jgi:hypothetical protein
MSERSDYPEGVPCWVDTLQPDVEAAKRFYGDLFGWSFTGPGVLPGDPPGDYYVAQLRGRDVAGIASQPSRGAPTVPVWNTHIAVESADKAAKKVKREGGRVVVEPFDALPAGRMAAMTDPAGASFCVWEGKDRKGAQIVNDIGAWAMSTLTTPDLKGAQAFYGAVFGWRSETMEMGESEITLWCLPGYVGGEPEQPVRRDVVAVMMPMTEDYSASSPHAHWGVAFWVTDTDSTVGKATKIGGKIIVQPYDIPGFRQAILADPQGATVTVASKKAAV